MVLGACLPTTPLPPFPTPTPTTSPTATPTVQWFPPTLTPTPLPTILPSPTVEWRPGVGATLLVETFNTTGHWSTGTKSQGTIAQGAGELSIVITQPKGYLYSVRDEPDLVNFYAEITASPTMCNGKDEYGFLFRYQSPADFYRFSLSFDGFVRLDRVVDGVATSPQPWLASASVPKGAPSLSRIAVWVVGREMRFFIDDEFQFSVSDRGLSNGVIGVFARSAGENAVTILFSNLVLWEVNP